MAETKYQNKNASLPPPDPVYILRGAGSPVTALEFSDPSSQSLLSGCQNGQVNLWDISLRRSKTSFDAHNSQRVLSLRFDMESDTLMTHGGDNFVKFWKNTGSTYSLDGKLATEMNGFCPALLLPQCNSSPLVAVPDKDSTISVYDIKSRSSVRRLDSGFDTSEVGFCMCLCAIPSSTGSTKLIAGYENGSMILFDIQTGKIQQNFSVFEDMVTCVAYSSAKLNKGLAGSVNETLVAWTISDDGKIKITNKMECKNAGFSHMKVRPDDRIVATAGWDKQVRIFSMKSFRPLAVLGYHREGVTCVDFSENNLLAVASRDNLISIWDIYSKV